ncbi:uncharacterized protein [Solanum lycopersicum]|uniref:uncharacterized protein n=1 Tax=Solanum lycopersicum TaxID=4081 RepID=UPI0037495E51
MVSKGCLDFLAHLRDDTFQVPSIESVSVVREFLDVFPADLPVLREKKLYAKFSKSEFWLDSVSFWRHVVSKDGVMVDPYKIEAVKSWGGFLACVEARSFFLDKIKGKQFTDEKLSRIRDMVLRGEAKEARIHEEGILRIKGRESLDKVKCIIEKFLAAQNRQKEYADRKVKDLDFMEGEQVLLKVSPIKGVMWFGKRGKLSPRYIGPFEVLKRVGEVAYELALPPGLSGVHPEPVAILDREVRNLKSREIASIKVQWKNRPVEDSTWEKEADIQEIYPHLFTDSGTLSRPCFLFVIV